MGVIYPFTFHVIIDVFEFVTTVSQLVFNLTSLFYVLSSPSWVLLGYAKSDAIFPVYWLAYFFTLFLVVIWEVTGFILTHSSWIYLCLVHCFHLETCVILNEPHWPQWNDFVFISCLNLTQLLFTEMACNFHQGFCPVSSALGDVSIRSGRPHCWVVGSLE